MSTIPVLYPLDESALRTQGLLLPSPTSTSHLLHKRRLNQFSDIEHHESPLSSPPPEDAFASIPAYLVSLETLIYIGLSEAKAGEVAALWRDFRAGSQADIDVDDGGVEKGAKFLDFIIGCTVEKTVDVFSEDDDEWRGCLDKCGVGAETQDGIMDPAFRYMRLSGSCLGWVRDTIEMRFRGLEEVRRTSRRREEELERVRGGGEWVNVFCG